MRKDQNPHVNPTTPNDAQDDSLMMDDQTEPTRPKFFEEETDIPKFREEDTQMPLKVAAKPSELKEPKPAEKPLAIVVDDDKDLGQVFSQALEMVGFQTAFIQDSRKAMAMIIERMPLLVSLDMQMPHVSGSDLLFQIRADSNLANIKVIMVSANGRVAEDNAIFQLADVILIKPVTFKQIKEFASRLTQP